MFEDLSKYKKILLKSIGDKKKHEKILKVGH